MEVRDASDTAIIIPCYKSASIIEATLEAAKKVFPPEHIFVIANGNSPTPLDNTEDICKRHGVHHVWIPVGSKVGQTTTPRTFFFDRSPNSIDIADCCTVCWLLCD